MPFRRGIKGKGGFPAEFDMAEHGLGTLKVENVNGAVFATFDHDAPPMREYLGDQNYRYLTRVFNGRKVKAIGYQRQRIECNWKLYMENIKDPYHASLLHVFLISFGLYRINQKGETVTDERALSHNVFASIRNAPGDTAGTEDMKSFRKNLVLNDMSMVTPTKEYEDDVTIQIQTIFPDLVLQQQGNSVQLRYVIPMGPDEFELLWTYFGYEDDSEETTLRRLRQANLTGPSGFVSVDDTEVLEYSGAGILANPAFEAVVELGGREGKPPADGNMVTEGPIRGFYADRRKMRVFLTEHGAELEPELMKVAEGVNRAMLEGLDGNDDSEVKAALRVIREHLVKACGNELGALVAEPPSIPYVGPKLVRASTPATVRKKATNE